MFGASVDRYSIGRYHEDTDTIKVSTRITQHGRTRTIFGGSREVFDVHMEATLNSAGELVGKAHPSDGDSFDLNIRMIRLGDLA